MTVLMILWFSYWDRLWMSSKSSELEPDPDCWLRLGYELREQRHEYGLVEQGHKIGQLELEQETEENRTPL